MLPGYTIKKYKPGYIILTWLLFWQRIRPPAAAAADHAFIVDQFFIRNYSGLVWIRYTILILLLSWYLIAGSCIYNIDKPGPAADQAAGKGSHNTTIYCGHAIPI